MQTLLAPDTFKFAVMACAAGAALCGVYAVASVLVAARRAHRALDETLVVPDMTSPLMRAFLPMARSLGLLIKALAGGRRPNSLHSHLTAVLTRRLSAPGRPQGINPDEYLGYGVLLSVFFGLAGVFAWMWLAESAVFSTYAYFGAGALAGVWYWYSWLGMRKFQYQRSIQRDLPFSLDLLTLAIEAGMDFTSALSRLVRKMPASALGGEFNLTLHEIQLGKQRADALRDFARRVDVPEVGTVVATLVQAEELGASLGPILRILSAQQRERRGQRAEETAMKAPVKILFPLVVCFFPCVVIVLMVPIVLNLASSGVAL